ncbi:hypothetical protein NE865_10900 [Phthorimaea operculella]|nr:hypothetical protein NE865_10900 [Phthorimaea operculella]
MRKPPMPYGRSSSAGVTSLVSPPGTPPAAPPSRVFRTEAQHRVEDHRNRGVSVERIIPINLPEEPASPLSPPPKQTTPAPATPTMVTSPLATPTTARPGPAHQPLRRLISNESNASDTCASPGGEPIKKSAREFIIPIAVEGKGYVTPRQRSLEPDTASASRLTRGTKPRRISNLVSGGESEEEDDSHMHRLRSTRAARAESVSSGEEDEEDEGFHLLTAENLFSTLLHRVRALTNRLNGEEGPGFPQHPHSLFNNLSHEPFFNSPHLPRRHLFHHRYVESKRSVSETREGWGSRDFNTDFDSMFSKARAPLPRGNSKKSKHHTKASQNAETESGLDLKPAATKLGVARSHSVTPGQTDNTPDASQTDSKPTESIKDELLKPPETINNETAKTPDSTTNEFAKTNESNKTEFAKTTESIKNEFTKTTDSIKNEFAKTSESVVRNAPEHRLSEEIELPAPQFCTLPRLKRHSTVSREATPPSVSEVEFQTRLSHERSKEPSQSRASSIRSTPDRPLLSKYLTPERTVSLDEPYSSSDGGSILSEPSYIAAYGTPGISGTSSLRRHSMRLAGEQPRKRISRFLRSDFFDTPPDESVYLKHKKEKELETQKILKEIREKKNKALDSPNIKSPTDATEAQMGKDDGSYTRKCLSPISVLTAKERSRSNTPFFPSLDGIKENALDMSLTRKDSKRYSKTDEIKDNYSTIDSTKDTKLTRPKSYPVKDSFEEPTENSVPEKVSNKENEGKEKTLPRESKLIRPKSYPTSSPSPEKVFINRNVKKEETNNVSTTQTTQKEENKTANEEIKTDVEVSFSITLPKKPKAVGSSKTDTLRKTKSLDKESDYKSDSTSTAEHSLTLKKYQIVSSNVEEKTDKDRKTENGSAISNGTSVVNTVKTNSEESKTTTTNSVSKVEEGKSKATENELTEKKQGTLKKKIIKKVSSKSKADAGTSQEGTDAKPTTEKKKVTKKVKEKTAEDGTKTATVTKKKSVLQSIGHKLEKFTSNKSSSPEKVADSVANTETKKESSKLSRTQREQSVPVNAEPPTESNLIKRAVTLTDVAALDTQNTTPSKTTVSKVLGLFKKFEPKEKVPKPTVEKSSSENLEANVEKNNKNEFSSQSAVELESDRPKRPTSLLLNGLGRKTKYGRAASDSVTAINVDDDEASKKDTMSKNIRNSLKLDFSRLPRVKKIVPTNPVIEPQLMNVSSDDKDFERKDIERNGTAIDDGYKIQVRGDENESHSRSRSRSRSTFSNSEQKSENSSEVKYYDKNPLSPIENNVHHPVRNHESTTPEKEDIVERIRRKSFYSRFNEKKQRRKSNLVGPGAAEYDPLARIHAAPSAADTKVDSPTSPVSYDLSPGYSVASDLSPSTDRYRSLLTDLPARNNLRFENYGLNDKVDTYRSLDRNEFRKYPRSYLDYDQPSSYTSHRYSRTKSLLDSSDGIEDHSHSSLRDPHLYNRTISMYAPGSYATYRPKRTLNPAIILKESEKEKSPENILEKIRQRKNFSIRVTRKPDPEKDPLPRSDGPPKGEGDSSERPEKVD